MKMRTRILLSLFSVGLLSNWLYAECTLKRKNILRSAPSLKAGRLRTLPIYTPLKVLSTQGPWLEVKGIDYRGWIYKTLVTDTYSCMIVKNSRSPYCHSSDKQLKRAVGHREGFKILKKEIGCNYVQDKNGKMVWLSSVNIWPESSAMLIKFPSQ